MEEEQEGVDATLQDFIAEGMELIEGGFTKFAGLYQTTVLANGQVVQVHVKVTADESEFI